MQQILALGALALAILLHFNAMNRGVRTEQTLLREEVEALGADLLQGTFDRLAVLPFDANADAKTTGHLTHEYAFGGAEWDAPSDIDDIDGASTEVRVQGPEGTLDFALTAEVTYARKSGGAWVESPGHERTWAKRVTVRARGPLGFEAAVERVFVAGGL